VSDESIPLIHFTCLKQSSIPLRSRSGTPCPKLNGWSFSRRQASSGMAHVRDQVRVVVDAFVCPVAEGVDDRPFSPSVAA
jgi:hypothetical protein